MSEDNEIPIVRAHDYKMRNNLIQKVKLLSDELGVTGVTVIFSSFSEKAVNPLNKGKGYNPKIHAIAFTSRKVIEINSDKLQDDDLYFFKNWDNIIAHEIGHFILDQPTVSAYYKDSPAGRALFHYLIEISNMSNDMTIANHVLPSKYTDFDLSLIQPWSDYVEAKKRINVASTRWGFQLGIVVNLPFWLSYGFYDDGVQGGRILAEVYQIVEEEPILLPMVQATEKLIKNFAEGLDSRTVSLQVLMNNGNKEFIKWVESQGKTL